VVRAWRQRRVPSDTVPGGVAGCPEAEDSGRPENAGRLQRRDGAARVPADGARVANGARHNVGNDRRWHGGQAVGGRTGGPGDRPIGPGPVRTAAGPRRRPKGLAAAVGCLQGSRRQPDASRELAGHVVRLPG